MNVDERRVTIAGVPLERTLENMTALAVNCEIPPHMVDGLMRYVFDHRPCGHFLTYVLENDLRRACSRADDDNKHKLWDYVFFLHNYVPAQCWGSPENVAEWLELGRIAREKQQNG